MCLVDILDIILIQSIKEIFLIHLQREMEQ